MSLISWRLNACILLVLTGALTGCASLIRVGAIQTIQKYRDRGQYQDAIRECDIAAAYSPEPLYQAELTFLKAECFEGLGRIEEAKGLYRFLVERCTDSHYSSQAATRLKALENPPQPPNEENEVLLPIRSPRRTARGI